MQTIQLRSAATADARDATSPEPPTDVWVDIDSTDEEGRRWLELESGLDDSIVRRLLEPSPATHWQRFGHGLHFHLRVLIPEADGPEVQVADFAFWLEHGRIITIRQGHVPALDRASRRCAAGTGPRTAWDLVVFLLSEGVGRVEQMLHSLTATVDELEDEVLREDGDPPINRVAELQKRLVYARRFRGPLANMVSFIASQPKLDDAIRDDLDEIRHQIAQQQDLLDLSIDRASALQGQMRDQMSDSMNSATYRFTWVATVFLPLSFLTGLLGINVAGIPGDHDPLAFWLVCAALLVIAVAWGIVVGRVTRRGGF
jgi:zinc transporter